MEEDPIYHEFINRNLRESTKERYNAILTLYCQSTGLTLTELINQAEEDEDNGIRLRKRRIKKHLDNHIQTFINKGYSPSNIRTNISILRVFYNHFEIQLPKIYVPKSDDNKTVDDIPGPEEIRLAVSHANAKYKSIILLMASSGMGIAEVLSLQITDLLKASKLDPTDIGELSNIHPKTVLWWEVVRVKTNHPYYTFSSPETTTAILHYLQQQPPQSVDDHLYRSGKGPTKNKPLQPKALLHYFKKLNNECEFGNRGWQSYFKAHNLRKYFATTCEKHIPHMATRHMMGHKFGGVEGAYFLRNQKALYNEYRKVVEHLAIVEPLTVLDTDEIVQDQAETIEWMKKEILALKRQKEMDDWIDKEKKG